MTMAAEPSFDKPDDETLERDLVRGAAVAVNSQGVAPAMREVLKGVSELSGINGNNQGNAQQAGFRAEVHHEATFNADAIRKGLRVRAVRLKDNGPVDLHIRREDQVVGKVQVKNCKTAARTTAAVSYKKYDGMQRVVPADQVGKVRNLAKARGVDGLGQRNYADTSKSATARVEHGGAASKPLKYDEPQSKRLGARMVKGEIGSAVRSGAQNGALIGGAVSAVGNIAAAWNEEKTPLEAAGSVAKDVTFAAVGGATSAAVTSAVTAGCTRLGVQALSKGGAPGAIAATGIEVVKDLVALGKGELTAAQVAGRGVEHAGGAGGAWGGAAAGAALGTALCPGVGTVIGGFVGGMAGNAGARKAIRGLKKMFSLDSFWNGEQRLC